MSTLPSKQNVDELTVRWPADRQAPTERELAVARTFLSEPGRVVRANSRVWAMALPSREQAVGEHVYVLRPAAVIQMGSTPIAVRLDGQTWSVTGERTWDLSGGRIVHGGGR